MKLNHDLWSMTLLLRISLTLTVLSPLCVAATKKVVFYLYTYIPFSKADEWDLYLSIVFVIGRMASCIQILQYVDIPYWSNPLLHSDVCH